MDSRIPQDENQHTQPYTQHPVFNNWDVIAEGWFFVCKSGDLKKGQIKSLTIGSQRIVIFRGTDGSQKALDAYCPHMGTDLAIGKVVGNHIQCYFHHWKFDGQGQCADIPCLKSGPYPPSAKLASYASCERYGSVWVWPAASAAHPLTEYPGLEGQELSVRVGRMFPMTCHPHVTMINGLDAQHLRTVHNLQLDMRLIESESSDGRTIEFVLEGEIPQSIPGRLGRIFMGPTYRYGMIYANGNFGLLTLLKDIPFRGKGPLLPRLHMIFAYRPVKRGHIEVHPIFFTRKREGFWGALTSQILLGITWMLYNTLKNEDGQVYDNIRFSPRSLLAIDQPIARFIAHVNRLKPSLWSKSRPHS